MRCVVVCSVKAGHNDTFTFFAFVGGEGNPFAPFRGRLCWRSDSSMQENRVMSIDDVQTNQLLIQFAVVNVDVRTTQWTFFSKVVCIIWSLTTSCTQRVFLCLCHGWLSAKAL